MFDTNIPLQHVCAVDKGLDKTHDEWIRNIDGVELSNITVL